MPPVLWHPEALEEFEAIIDFIDARNPPAAARLAATIRDTAERLPDHPYLYRPGRIPGTREAVVHPNYILVYRVGDLIEVMGVVHARQHYP